MSGFVVYSSQEYRLIENRHPGVEKNAHGGFEALGKLARMIGVNNHPYPLVLPQHSGKLFGHARGQHDGHAGADANDVAIVHGKQLFNDSFQVLIREHQRIAAGEEKLLDFRGPPQIDTGRLQLLLGDPAPAMTGEMASKAMTTIRGASIAHQKEGAIPIVMDEPIRHQVARVANRIARFVGQYGALIFGGHELRRNRIHPRVQALSEARVVAADAVWQAAEGFHALEDIGGDFRFCTVVIHRGQDRRNSASGQQTRRWLTRLRSDLPPPPVPPDPLPA